MRCSLVLDYDHLTDGLDTLSLKEHMLGAHQTDALCAEGDSLLRVMRRIRIGADLQLTTPMIEVADDGKTAKCVWWCPGVGARTDEEGAHALWIWGQTAVDFIRLQEVWKVWHLHYFRLIKCSYEKGWVEDLSMINRFNTPMHPKSLPSTYHNPYSPLSIRDGIPCPPRPYHTYTQADRFWELNRDKR